LTNAPTGAVHHADGFHYATRASDIDLPHALNIENSGALRIDYKRQMHYRVGTRLP
jgi:hypothetical protein